MSSPKLERLLNLTALLLNASLPVSAEQIQTALDYPDDVVAFRRAFERDKDELRAMGIPLRLASVPGKLPAVDGYRIPPEEYALRDPGLTIDELGALHLAASAVQVEGFSATAGLWKLGGIVAAGGSDIGVRVAPLPADPNLACLFAAVASRTPVTMRYGDEDRTIDPYRLEFLRGRWYLTGYDHLREAERNFRLGRIQGTVVPTDGPAFAAPQAPLQGRAEGPWELGDDEPIVARLRIGGPPAQWALQHFGPDRIVEVAEDGSVVIDLPVNHRSAFRSFVLSFLDHAEILSPVELREDLILWLRGIT